MFSASALDAYQTCPNEVLPACAVYKRRCVIIKVICDLIPWTLNLLCTEQANGLELHSVSIATESICEAS